MLKLGIVVEGAGDQAAVGSLVTKVLRHLGLFEWVVASVVPTKGSGNLDRTNKGLEHYVAIAGEGNNAVLVLRDSDGAHPPDLAIDYAKRLIKSTSGKVVAICIPHQEFENWLLANMVSIRGKAWGKEQGINEDAPIPVSPEAESAKAYLTRYRNTSSRYKPAIHQHLITKHFDPATCANSCSYKVLCKRLQQIDEAVKNSLIVVIPNTQTLH